MLVVAKAVVTRYLAVGKFFAKITPNTVDDWAVGILDGLVSSTEILDLIWDLFLKGMAPAQVVAALRDGIKPPA